MIQFRGVLSGLRLKRHYAAPNYVRLLFDLFDVRQKRWFCQRAYLTRWHAHRMADLHADPLGHLTSLETQGGTRRYDERMQKPEGEVNTAGCHSVGIH